MPHRLLLSSARRRALGLALSTLAVFSLAFTAGPDASSVARYFLETLVPHETLDRARIRLIDENEIAWYARWHAISSARHTIDLTYFNFYADTFGKSLLGLLERKAREGVEIRMMIDNRGSFAISRRVFAQRYLQQLAQLPNVTIRVYRSWHRALFNIPERFRDFIASNHDKILLVDGELIVMGGRNLGKKYLTSPQDDPSAYRDFDVMIQGEEIGRQVQEAFESEFEHLDNDEIGAPIGPDVFKRAFDLTFHEQSMDRWIRGQDLIDPESTRYPKRARGINAALEKLQHSRNFAAFDQDTWAEGHECPTVILDKHSLGGSQNQITPKLIGLFDAAEHSIVMQNAYLVITPEAFAALKRASDRGVDITIHTNSPASTHNLFTQAFFVRDWKTWLHEIPRMRIFMTTGPRKIHSKVFVIDDEVMLVGSYNIDPMSQSINSEIVSLFLSKPLADKAKACIEREVAEGVECRIRLDSEGRPVRVTGPEDYLRGFTGLMIRIISKLGFLWSIV